MPKLKSKRRYTIRVRPLLAILLVLMSAVAVSQKAALKLKPGDKLAVGVFGVDTYNSECIVLSDGSISGKGFGRLPVEGKTLDQVKSELTKRFATFIKNPSVSVVLLSERVEYIYISGAKAPSGGAVPWTPETNLRQVLATLDLKEDPDLFEITVYRGAAQLVRGNLSEVLISDRDGGMALKGGDVVTVLPVDFVRVWVTGAVVRPGQIRLPAGATLAQAVAAAGDIVTSGGTLDDYEITLRRGDSFQIFGARSGTNESKLESGDTVTIQARRIVRVTVGGEVARPGEVTLRADPTLDAAVATAGGVTEFGTKQNAILVRRGIAQQVTLDPKVPTKLDDGDFVLVQRNQRQVLAVGEARSPGVVLLRDDKEYRLSDILAQAGGLTPDGALRRVYLGRFQPDGKMKVVTYALDKFFKDGDVTSNPVVQPGDVVLFGDRKGVTLGNAQQILSSAVLLFNIVRN